MILLNMEEIIIKKRDGKILGSEEINFFINGYTKGEIPDYQASALLMSIYFQGLSEKEITDLTEAMMLSGDVVDLSEIKGIKVDKHSTGGVGDKTTLIVAPIAAAAGVPVAKMSGRGLGFTGGTRDKLESVPGYKTALTQKEFIDQVNEIGISLIGQTADIAVADKKLYSLRDVTGTVGSLGLITASIMSKKLASGGDAIVLDVKCGRGGFMKTKEEARKLADLMIKIGEKHGKKTAALITDMNEPLGNAVGNTLEVIEAIETLKGKGPEDITKLSFEIAGHMILLGKKARSIEDAVESAKEVLYSGKALDKFRRLIDAQGGDPKIIDDYSLLGKAKYENNIISQKNGVIKEIDAQKVGEAAQLLGAGRVTKEDDIDFCAGVLLSKKIGAGVSKRDVLATVFSEDRKKLKLGSDRLKESIIIT